MFVSKTIRFGREAKGSRKGVALCPGPGTYSESNKWKKKDAQVHGGPDGPTGHVPEGTHSAVSAGT